MTDAMTVVSDARAMRVRHAITVVDTNNIIMSVKFMKKNLNISNNISA